MSLNNCQECGEPTGIWRYPQSVHICNYCFTGTPKPIEPQEHLAHTMDFILSQLTRIADALEYIVQFKESEKSITAFKRALQNK